MRLEDHPTVKWYRNQLRTKDQSTESAKLDADWLRELCIQKGADDVGFVHIDHPALADQRGDLLGIMPETKTVVGMVFRVSRESVRTVEHSLANLEFRHAGDLANRTARKIVAELRDGGVRAVNPPAGFPYEPERWPGKIWLTNDKVIAAEAGLGHMGWNRLVIHPVFGDCIVIGGILVASELTSYSAPLDYNPCIECKLCVSVCPVGAVGADGQFDFMSCYAHNYRERLGGFQAWIENLVASRDVKDYRKRVSDWETISMWQNLSMYAQTKCDRCMAVCPAGKECIGEFLSDRKAYTDRYVRPMRDKQETIYVVRGSDAEAHVTSRFPNKRAKRVFNGIRPGSAQAFLRSLPIAFQRNRSEGLNATFHFTFTGEEECKGSAVIRNKTIQVHDDHVGDPDLHVIADSRAWVSFLAKELSLLRALITRKIRVKGSPKLMQAFAKCFPS